MQKLVLKQEVQKELKDRSNVQELLKQEDKQEVFVELKVKKLVQVSGLLEMRQERQEESKVRKSEQQTCRKSSSVGIKKLETTHKLKVPIVHE